MTIDSLLQSQIAAHPFPLLFMTVSGAHLYGFPSPDSDYDLRGAHRLPLSDVIGLKTGRETVEASSIQNGLEIDLVTHDVKKFFELLLKKNGYVLEQLLSPLIIHTTPEHEELKSLAPACLTRHHAHHYLGFSHTQWKLFQKENPPRVKPLLYLFRVLLTGIHLMRSGEVEANLPRLNEIFRLPYLPELIAQKTEGTEKGTLENHDLPFFEQELNRLRSELESAHEQSHLPDHPTATAALNDLLIRLRLDNPR